MKKEAGIGPYLKKAAKLLFYLYEGEQRLSQSIFRKQNRVGDMIDRRRVGQDLPQCVVLHVLGQLHEDRVPVRVLDREHPLKADSEFWIDKKCKKMNQKWPIGCSVTNVKAHSHLLHLMPFVRQMVALMQRDRKTPISELTQSTVESTDCCGKCE